MKIEVSFKPNTVIALCGAFSWLLFLVIPAVLGLFGVFPQFCAGVMIGVLVHKYPLDWLEDWLFKKAVGKITFKEQNKTSVPQ